MSNLSDKEIDSLEKYDIGSFSKKMGFRSDFYTTNETMEFENTTNDNFILITENNYTLGGIRRKYNVKDLGKFIKAVNHIHDGPTI
jgi:hypothetical protein